MKILQRLIDLLLIAIPMFPTGVSDLTSLLYIPKFGTICKTICPSLEVMLTASLHAWKLLTISATNEILHEILELQ